MSGLPNPGLPQVQYSSQPEVTYIRASEDECHLQEQIAALTKILAEADPNDIKNIKTIHFDQKITVVVHPLTIKYVELK